MITIERYTPDMQPQWDELVANSRNATFLHLRDYMDYHADRFADFSLMARNDHGRLLAVLPACIEGDTFYSHRGLTYGGWLMPQRRCDALDMLEIWDAMTAFLRSSGVKQLIYKPVPHIYHSYPSEEDIYALWRAGGQLHTSLVSTVVDLRRPLPFDQGLRQRARRAAALGNVTYSESTDYAAFWQVLTTLLRTRFNSAPVHSLAEIELLHSRFPRNIRLFTATEGGQLLAGIVVYVCNRAAHSQYTAATDRGKELSVVHALYQHIMDQLRSEVDYFDFGTSNEAAGREVNPGLLRQKCSYGGRAITYNTFKITF